MPHDVRHFGCRGDGLTLDTVGFQAAIDACHDTGGGTVVVPAGRFVTGTVILRSRVELHLSAGAVLLASLDLTSFPSLPSRHPSYDGALETHKALILADDAEDIAISGMGTIDGRCDELMVPFGFPSFSLRPRLIHLRGCRRIRIRDVLLRNAATWVQHYLLCSDLRIDGVTVDSRENPDIGAPRFATCKGLNQDGLDIDSCRDVRVSGCTINSGDDAICLKSRPGVPCTDVVISDCTVSSNASAIKLGTESLGDFRRIAISNCTVRDTRCDGVSVIMVDGGVCEQVSISGVVMDNVKGAALFVRLGDRGSPLRPGDPHRPMGVMRGIAISDVLATRVGGVCGDDHAVRRLGSSITGLPGHPIRDLSLDRIRICAIGGGQPVITVPELPEAYPNGRMFGELPAWGLYCRHVDGLRIHGLDLHLESADARPPIMFDDCCRVDLGQIRADGDHGAAGPVRWVDQA
jgi:polygalacturonase